MWKGRVGSLVAPCDRRGRDEVEIHLVFGVSREPVQPVRPPRQETLFLADSSRLRAARLPCPRFSLSWFLFPPDPYGIVSLSKGLDPEERTVVVLAGGFFFAFAIHPFSPSRFLPRMFLLTHHSPDRERKSWELNECRVPLEGSLSMPRRETPVLAS